VEVLVTGWYLQQPAQQGTLTQWRWNEHELFSAIRIISNGVLAVSRSHFFELGKNPVKDSWTGSWGKKDPRAGRESDLQQKGTTIARKGTNKQTVEHNHPQGTFVKETIILHM
jgi:hypothetical protein